jgi:cellulose biosynthesis protein BcsQ
LYPSEISFRVKIVAVTNIKGGVGKTTTAVNLAYLCAAGGRPTVLWDLDPQGAATYTLKCEPGERVSARKLVAGKRELPELIVHTGYDKLDVLRAADVVVVPLLPTPLSVRMLVQLQEFVAAEGWTDMRLLPFFSMVDRRKSLHHEVIASTRADFPALLATEVPYSSEIERMTQRRAPLPAFSPRSAVGQVYAALWAEVEAHMGAE